MGGRSTMGGSPTAIDAREGGAHPEAQAQRLAGGEVVGEESAGMWLGAADGHPPVRSSIAASFATATATATTIRRARASLGALPEWDSRARIP